MKILILLSLLFHPQGSIIPFHSLNIVFVYSELRVHLLYMYVTCTVSLPLWGISALCYPSFHPHPNYKYHEHHIFIYPWPTAFLVIIKQRFSDILMRGYKRVDTWILFPILRLCFTITLLARHWWKDYWLKKSKHSVYYRQPNVLNWLWLWGASFTFAN